jgi:signal transduction histidine kinase
MTDLDSMFRPRRSGTGLRNLADRLAAVGGTMTIHSTPGQGTTVEGSIPLP